ncbi:hypothetical protein BOX15_Mlig018534g2 [Macrostomum lignano]|uniref:Adenylate kinase 7 n=1 Tax=Macrostomum lignano TaxID=282301 RepID=A0A267EVK4_9PLAT|nr:hypothetical protein BOX15_Mlig018534g2 [Macrostomum lignano]
MAAEATKPVRIFVNHVDEYQGYHISKYLSQCAVGATLEDNEEEEEEAGSVLSGDFPVKPKEGCYEIHGTLKKTGAKQPEFVKEILSYDTREQMYEHLVECDVIVYDITQDPDQIEEAMWALTELHQDIEKLESQKVFILLSTVMTWAKSKPADEEDLESPLTEEDYRKRKPHQNYKEHLAAEKAAVKYGKTKKSRLTTYIVASGLTYGCGENIFHSFFKAAWHNAFTLPVYGNGQNVLPMIHIRDLAAVLQNIADSKPKVKYLVAVDDSQNMLDEVVKAVSVGLCTGKIRTVTKEEAALSKDIDQATLDQLMLSLRLDAIYVKENFKINWACETGIVENIDQIIKEYKKERGLQPIKACILGPPASGKSVIVKQLCDFYKLHHIRAKDVITEAIANLQRSAARADAEEEDDDGKAAEDAETLEQVNENMAENNDRLDDSFVIRFFREKLASKACQNQGFILDGFPKTKQQAEDLFAPDEDDEEEGEDGGGPFNKRLMPDQLFVLEAGDDFLKRRVMQLPEAVVAGTHNTEEGLLRRLSEYRAINTEDDSVVMYFDEKEIHPDVFDVSKDDSTMHAALVERIKKAIGKPRNYGLTPEEQEEIRRREETERLENEKRERDERERRERQEADERKRCQEEWAARLEEVKREEHELLEIRSEPLRNYLMKHVMPNLTKGLMECAKVRPDDAIDYLAEYLFRNNPQVD